MKIGIDARFAVGINTGVANYVVKLIEKLSAIDEKNEYYLYFQQDNGSYSTPLARNFSKRVVHSLFPPFIWKNTALPIAIKNDKIDIFHGPAYTLPAVGLGSSVVTIHDVIHEVNPRWFRLKDKLRLKLPVKISANRADLIISDSENAKEDIRRFYNISENKIRVIYLGVDTIFSREITQKDIARVKARYGITSDYILNIGVLFLRRNIPRLLSAFKKVVGTASGKDYRLVIVGHDRKLFDLKRVISDYGLGQKVIHINYLSPEDLPAMYRAAKIMVYPSLYEGFGLPILEAMASGVPVVTSNVSSLPEVAGDSALLVNPYIVDKIAEAILGLLEDGSLYEALRAKGLKRASGFSWGKTARETLSVYQEAYSLCS